MFEATWRKGDTVVRVDTRADVLQHLVAQRLGTDAADLRIRHSCPHCGSRVHGAPFVDAPVFVSRSYCDDLTAAAVSDEPIGVDIESSDRIAHAAIESVLLHTQEAVPENTKGLAGLWAAKEAVLKLARTGLRIEPSRLRFDESMHLVEWPDELDFARTPTVHLFDVTANVVGAVALA